MRTNKQLVICYVSALLGLGVIAIAAVLFQGALALSSDVGYAGVGANFLPLLLAGLLCLCGVFLVFQALTGGLRQLDFESLAVTPSWAAFLYISAALLLNALLISSIGFILSCALCYAIAVRGIRCGQAMPAGCLSQTARDFLIGLLIAAPVFWLFTKLLNVSLPGFALWGIDAMGWF